jgi:hypothetical protein
VSADSVRNLNAKANADMAGTATATISSLQSLLAHCVLCQDAPVTLGDVVPGPHWVPGADEGRPAGLRRQNRKHH